MDIQVTEKLCARRFNQILKLIGGHNYETEMINDPTTRSRSQKALEKKAHFSKSSPKWDGQEVP